MITKIDESKYGLNLTLEPETIEDFSLLLRFGMNALAEKPNVFVSFDNKPYCNIYLRKRKEIVQLNSINPSTRRK
jgi:hypothetical protein